MPSTNALPCRLLALLQGLLPGLFLAALLLPLTAQAQDDVALAAEFQSESISLAEQEKFVTLPPPSDAAPLQTCIHYHQRGVANFRLGRYEQAVADLRQALALNQPRQSGPNNWCDRWRIQNDLNINLVAQSDHFAQLEHLQTVAAEYRPKNALRYFMTLHKMLDPNAALGLLPQAQEAFERASQILPGLAARPNWAVEQHLALQSHNTSLARLQEWRGNHAEAERFYRAALDHARQYLQWMIEHENPQSQTLRLARIRLMATVRFLAVNLATQGKLGEAELLTREAITATLAFLGLGTTGMSNNLALLANIRLQQGQLDTAERYQTMSLKALEKAQVKAWSTVTATRRSRMGLILCVQGRWQEALSLFELRDQDLRSNAAQFERFGSGDIDWAMALLKTGDATQAANMLQRMLERTLKKTWHDPQHADWLRGYLAIALAEQGKTGPALSLFAQALPNLQKRSHETGDGNEESSFVADYRLRVILEAYLELLAERQVREQPVPGLDLISEAFKVADIARQSAVQRAVNASAARATLPDPQLAQLARQQQDANNRLVALNRILQRLAASPEAQRLPKVMQGMQQEIEQLGAQQTRLKAELAGKFPDYANLVNPPATTPADIQQALQDGEALVSLFSGERFVYVWTISKQAIKFRRITQSRKQIASAVQQILDGMDLSDGKIKPFAFAQAHALYADLLQADAGQWEKAKVLNVIGHGALSRLPWALLLTAAPASSEAKPGQVKPNQATSNQILPDYAAMPWLIRKVALAQQSSASSFVSLRKSRGQTGERTPFIGFGDPLFAKAGSDVGNKPGTGTTRKLQLAGQRDNMLRQLEQDSKKSAPDDPENATKANGTISPTILADAFALLPALPDTAFELRDIARATGADQARELYLGARASEANLKALNLSHYRVLAIATHGLVPDDLAGLNQPALALSNPALVNDSSNDGFLTLEEVLGLKLNAEWVVLSACNSASSDGNASEAVSGLGRAFFYAGTRSLLLSYWAVETVSARWLTAGVFTQQAAHPELSRAQALRESMLTLLNSKEYGHPVFWAAFSLVGDGVR